MPASELSLYSRPPLWSYSREQSTSLSDLACSHCPTHTHTPKHTSTQTPLCNKQREQSFCLLRCEALNDTAVYVNVHVCEHLIIHPSPPTSLPLVHSLFSPHPQPAFQQPATKTQRFQKTSRHLSPFLHLLLFNSPTHTQPQRNSVSSGQARAEMIFSPLLLPASDLPTPTVPFPLSVNYIAAVVGVAGVVVVCARVSACHLGSV